MRQAKTTAGFCFVLFFKSFSSSFKGGKIKKKKLQSGRSPPNAPSSTENNTSHFHHFSYRKELDFLEHLFLSRNPKFFSNVNWSTWREGKKPLCTELQGCSRAPWNWQMTSAVLDTHSPHNQDSESHQCFYTSRWDLYVPCWSQASSNSPAEDGGKVILRAREQSAQAKARKGYCWAEVSRNFSENFSAFHLSKYLCWYLITAAFL